MSTRKTMLVGRHTRGYVTTKANDSGTVLDVGFYHPDGTFVPAPRIKGYKDHGGLSGSYQWGYPHQQALQYLRWLNGGDPRDFEPEFL